jgi:protocatechuate 3,4-dioxygenase, alpha subunit
MTADDGNRSAATNQMVRTPRTIFGPYVTLGMPLRSAVETDDGRVPFTVTGRVLKGSGEPVGMTSIETTQPEGWTRSFTGPDGVYTISTVKPKAPAGRAPHLTVLVNTGRMIRPAVTCLYFPDEDNDADELLLRLSPEQRATMLARAVDGGYEFDIHLAGQSETAFLGWPGLLDDDE